MVEQVFEAGGSAAVTDDPGWTHLPPVESVVAPVFDFAAYFPDGLGDDCAAVFEEIAAAGPDPGTWAVLSRIDPARLSEFDRVSYLQACRALAGSVAALELAAVAAVAGPRPHARKVEEQSAVAEVRAGTRLTWHAARDSVGLARALATRLPATRRALAEGRISREHADAIADATMPLDEDAAAWVEGQVLPTAVKGTVPATRAEAAQAALAADPVAAGARAKTARKDRRIERWRGADPAWATLAAHGAPADIETIWAALDAQAVSCFGLADPRGIDARRFDVLLGWATGTLLPPDTAPPRRVGVDVTVDLPTLLGLAEHPAHLRGYGPIPAAVARALAGEDGAAWRRLVFDPVTGYALDYGTSTYRPPAALRRYLIARDGTSRFPGESVPAARCDIDHAVPAPAGATSAANTGPLGRTGHRLKTHTRWDLESFPDGRARWRSPTGHTYWHHPIDHRPQPVRHTTGDSQAAASQPPLPLDEADLPDPYSWQAPPDWLQPIDWHHTEPPAPDETGPLSGSGPAVG